MQDRFQPSFSERAGQSEAAKLANLEAFRAALVPNSQENIESTTQAPEMPLVMTTTSLDSKVTSSPKSLLRWVPRRARTPLLAATAGVAALGAAACTSGSNTEVSHAPTNQGGVLGGAHVTPVPNASTESGQPNQTEQYKQAPDFTLKDKNGNPVSMHFGGRSAIVLYSGTGACPPCRRESKKIAEIREKYASQGLAVLHITREYDPNYGEDMTVLLDPQQEVAKKYDMLLANPGTVFIRDGKIVYRYFGYNDENSDFDQLAAALMAGKDLEGILPTATPGPTETSTPVITKEKPSSKEAVFDLGNFDLGVKEWEEWPNARPTQLEVGGKVVDVKNVVVKTIFRSRADRVSNLIESAEELLSSNVSFVDSNGQDIVYYPGSGRISFKIDEPLKYGGAINEPFAQNLKGDFIDTGLLCSSKKYTLDRFISGYGIAVSIIAAVPINVRDYGVAILEPGASKRKIVMKDEAAADFKTIADDVPIHDPDYVFRLQGNGEYVDSSFRGLQRVQYSPGFPPDTLATFHFIDRLQSNPFYYFLLQGNLFLKDGRVLQMDFAEGSLNFGQEGDLQGNVGGINPESKCPLINHNTLQNAYGFDLKGSVAVVNFGFQSVAWKMPD